MTIGERRHEEFEQRIADLLEEQDLRLHKAGGLYTISDMDGQSVTYEPITLEEIARFIESW